MFTRKKYISTWRNSVGNNHFSTCYLVTTDCTTAIYTKANGGKACGVLLSNTYFYADAINACAEHGARLPEATSLADFNTLTGLMVNKRWEQTQKFNADFISTVLLTYNWLLKQIKIVGKCYILNWSSGHIKLFPQQKHN